jgi:hypothetical protein
MVITFTAAVICERGTEITPNRQSLAYNRNWNVTGSGEAPQQ